MGLLFKKLNRIINEKTSGSKSLTISETLRNKKDGDLVLVGGIIENVITINEGDPTTAIVDDGVGKVFISILPEIFIKTESKFNVGNVVIVKGYYTEKKYLQKHPENKNESFTYVNCTAVTVVEED